MMNNSKYPNLTTFLQHSCGATLVDDLIEGGIKGLPLAEDFLTAHPEYVKGIPFPEEDPIFDQHMADSKGANVLQDIVDEFG